MQKSVFSYRNFNLHFISQFSEALNDSILRNIVIIFITFYFQSQEASFSALVNFLMISPFILFAKLSGNLSDKYPTRLVALYVKVSEIVIIIIFFIAYLQKSILTMMISLFFMGTHSAFFSPIKMSLIKKLLPESLIHRGNAYVQVSTYTSLILGVIFARIFIDYPYIIFAFMFIIANVALISTYLIELHEMTKDDIIIKYNPLKNIRDSISNTFANHDLKMTILGITTALFIIATMSSLMPAIIKKYLAGDKTILSLLTVIPVLGIVTGSLLNSKIKQRFSNKYIALSLFMIGLCFLSISSIIQDQEIKYSHFMEITLNQFLFNYNNIWLMITLFVLGIISAFLIVPLYLNIQILSDKNNIGRNVATQTTFSSTFGHILASIYIIILQTIRCDEKLILVLITSKIFLASYCFFINIENSIIIPRFIIHKIVGFFLIPFRVSVEGLENIEKTEKNKNIFIANHISFIDGILVVYAAHIKQIVPVISKSFLTKNPWMAVLLKGILEKFYVVDESNPMGIKNLIKFINDTDDDINVLIFPEGRLSNNNILMKMFDGPSKISLDTNSDIIPIFLDGPEKSIFSRTKSKLEYFPKITVFFRQAIKVSSFKHIEDQKEKIQSITQKMYDVLCDMNTKIKINNSSTLFQSLIEKYKNSKSKEIIFTDHEKYYLEQGESIYTVLISAIALGDEIKKIQKFSNATNVGLLVPSTPATLKAFYAIQYAKLVPAIINFTNGVQTIQNSLNIAKIKTIYTFRKFIKKGNLEELVDTLSNNYHIVYIEDINPLNTNTTNIISRMIMRTKLFFAYIAPQQFYYPNNPNSAAVILFTSGSEGHPKAVNLSHINLQSNISQLTSKIDTNTSDCLFHALPIFHSFGLITMLLAVQSNIKTLFFPDPKRYIFIPNLIYNANATILFSTNTFLKLYAEYAHQYDFYSLRYVFAGAEKLENSTRQMFFEKFGIRILEGYGATETSPVISVCSNMHYKVDTVGRFLPLIEHKIVPVEGISEGGELHIKGPNVMLGYMTINNPGKINYLKSWYNTGDIVSIDNKGFIKILGRIKRFAKIAGEMISLTVCEDLVQSDNIKNEICCVVIKNNKDQETIVCLSTIAIEQDNIIKLCKEKGISTMHLPKIYFQVKEIIKLSTGKNNYPEMQKIAQKLFIDTN